MARSLRDELLRAGLVTSEQASRAERARRPSTKPARGRVADKPHGAGRRSKRHAARSEPRESPGRSPPVPVESPGPDPEERVRRINLEIRRILDTEAEKFGAEAETDTPFHFPRGERLKRLYVSEEQRRRLAAGELAIVGFRGRHHLVPRPAGERVHALRPEVFVFVAGGDDGTDKVEEGYEGYEVPDELRW